MLDLAACIEHSATPWTRRTPWMAVLAGEIARHGVEGVANEARRRGLERRCPVAFLDEIAGADLSHGPWTPTIARARRAAAPGAGTDDVLQAAAQIVLEFIQSCPPGRIRAKWTEPLALVLPPAILPPTRSLRALWSGAELVVAGDGFEASFEVTTRGRRLTSFVGPTARGLVSTLPCDPPAVWERHDGHAFGRWPAHRPSIGPSTDAVRRSAALLGAHLPDVAGWIDPVIHSVLPLAKPARGFHSGSSATLPGVVAITLPLAPHLFVESLLHEASHQYFFMLSHAVQLTVASAGRLYHSPLRGSRRPLDKILLAYHAAANIATLHRLLADLDGSAPPPEELGRSRADAETLAEHLDGNHDLTEHGHAFFGAIASSTSLGAEQRQDG